VFLTKECVQLGMCHFISCLVAAAATCGVTVVLSLVQTCYISIDVELKAALCSVGACHTALFK